MPVLDALLLDFDGLLADYDHPRFLLQLADAAGCSTQQVDSALRGEHIELAHARGELDGTQLLQVLNNRIGARLQASDWQRARLAATSVRRDCISVLDQLRVDARFAVLTNNGMLTLPVLQQLLPGRTVLCSALLGVRKPDPAAYHAACNTLQCDPARTLFVDHLFRNVQGARAAGLQSDTAYHAQSLRRLLRRQHLLR